MRPQILSTGPLPEWAVERLSARHPVKILRDPAVEEILANLSGTTALIARSSGKVGAAVLEAAPGLQVVARTGVGYDNIDVEAATRLRIPVLYTPGALSLPVAEHTAAFLLAAAKNLRHWHRTVLDGGWRERDRQMNADLFGSTLGIIGFGRIGTQVYRVLRPFGIRFLINDPYVDPSAWSGDDLVFVGLEELLSRSDAVTVHVPLTAETRNLIHQGNLERFKAGAVLINTSRGPVIESHRLLLEGLESGRLGFVLLDTPVEEPPDPADPLLHHPRLLMTPHNASRTPLGQKRVIETMVEDLCGFLEGRLPPREHVVNPQVMEERAR